MTVPIEASGRPRVNRADIGGVAGDATITTHVVTGASLLRLVGDIDLNVVPALRAACESAVAAHAWVLVDLSRVGIIDSVGLSVLVRIGLVARRAGGDLLMVSPPRHLRSARLAITFGVYDTLPQAMTAASAAERSHRRRWPLTQRRDEARR